MVRLTEFDFCSLLIEVREKKFGRDQSPADFIAAIARYGGKMSRDQLKKIADKTSFLMPPATESWLLACGWSMSAFYAELERRRSLHAARAHPSPPQGKPKRA